MIMEFLPKVQGTLFGNRYYYEVTKRVRYMPGFVPEYQAYKVCDIVVDFKERGVYVTFSDECPNMITTDDLGEILKVANKGFIESDFYGVAPTL